MDFRFSQFEILTGAGTLIVCLFFICVFTEVSAIENEIGASVTEAVASEELYWSGVEVSGQTVLLTGSAPDVPAKHDAEKRAWTIPGVTAVSNTIQVIGEAGTCQRQLDEYLTKERISFKTGKADVADASYHTISMLAMIVRSCSTPLEIAGHTDSKGDAEINLLLSQRRADVVARHLVRHGVKPSQLKAVGYGESQPIADNGSDAGRKQNRRIEFRVLGGMA
ncbi:MAG: OmpA family protein [Gammaproteobacteria bacterium]|nr:OmpA family protein [Gammaproteobacteria bacterium]